MAIIERHLEAGTKAPSERGPSGRTPSRRGPARATTLPLGLAWLVLFPLALALEPAAAVPETVPMWEIAAGIVLLTGLGLTAVGLGFRKPWAAGASLVTSLVFATGVFACPATGHHAFGLWWFGELAAALALVSLSAVALVRTRTAR